MFKRISCLFTLAVVAAVLTMSVAAQGRGGKVNDPKMPSPVEKGALTKVALQIDNVGAQIEYPRFKITNNTAASLPAGTKVYWKKNSKMQGVQTLSSALAKGASFEFAAENTGDGTNQLAAWFFKKQ